jgi:hypothetical protein
MWSLTLQRVRRTGGPENFQSSVKKDFFNSIGAKRTFDETPTSAKCPISRNAARFRHQINTG